MSINDQDPMTIDLNAMKHLSFREISQLPCSNSEDLIIKNKKYTKTVWAEKISDSEIKVVIQYYREFILGFKAISAVGFIKSSSEEARDLTDEELYEYTQEYGKSEFKESKFPLQISLRISNRRFFKKIIYY